MEKSIYSAEYQQVCQLLRELRHEAGLTQMQVAERLGVPQSFVSKYEAGQRRLDIVELRHVGEVLGISIVAMLTRLDLRWTAGK
ncbi:helix-turn-helix transcriptional regulator [Amycolatopsis sp.]|uniref:helix-turn-helix domain-containing protein n=1 Tax=Amycolatopsis sp. TaxID=37632 RepID=UPI002C998607|nr:helix-turn-helix transcriptional regulator [Amycolatopsis sp.]HVV09031.1 helix-turn-helix transcriptional regulator [Amycolatopsis sp.]